MTQNPTVVLFVADAVGIPTLQYMLDKSVYPIQLPTLEQLGLGNLLDSQYHSRIHPNVSAAGARAVLQVSQDADSVIGHRELVGIVTPDHYDLFPEGFPQEVVTAVERETKRRFFYNRMAGGMDAIKDNNMKHRRTGRIILYSSVCDPLAQLAAHEDIIPAQELAKITDVFYRIAREQEVNLTRVISRPYTGNARKGFTRTNNRHDAVLPLPGPTLIDILREQGIWVASVGKFADMVPTIYSQRWKLSDRSTVDAEWKWISDKDNNPYSFQGTLEAIQTAHSHEGGLIVVNAVDTDALWGHTLQYEGWLKAVEALDHGIGRLLAQLQDGDLFVLTADHGMQERARLDKPTATYGYHNKEPVPVLAYTPTGSSLSSVDTQRGLSDVGLHIAKMFGVEERYENMRNQKQ